MNKKIVSEFKGLEGPFQEKICTIIGKLIKAGRVYSPRSPFPYTIRRQYYGDNFYDELLFLEKLSKWGQINFQKIGANEYLIKTDLNQLEEAENFFWSIVKQGRTRANKERMDEEFRKKQKEKQEQKQKTFPWSNDFRWEENKFVFGDLGHITFQSESRKALFEKLTDAKGDWVTKKELAGSASIKISAVGPTIAQIEARFITSKIRHIEIVPRKTEQGAYRIKYIRE